jgi:hypothetical protein
MMAALLPALLSLTKCSQPLELVYNGRRCCANPAAADVHKVLDLCCTLWLLLLLLLLLWTSWGIAAAAAAAAGACDQHSANIQGLAVATSNTVTCPADVILCPASSMEF